MDLKNPIFFETPRLRKFYESNFNQITNTTGSNKKVRDIISSANNKNNNSITKDLFSQLLEDTNENKNKHNQFNFNNNDKEIVSFSYQSNKYSLNNLNLSYNISGDYSQLKGSFLNELQNCQQIKGKINNNKRNQSNQQKEKMIKKRKRKSNQQIQLLQQEFEGEIEWTKEKITAVSKDTGLSESQVYKWCWDQKKKQNKEFQQQEQHIIEWHLKQSINKTIKKEKNKEVQKRLEFN